MIRTFLVDDEPMARAKLRRLLQGAPDVELVGEADSAESATRAIGALRPDLVFLDVDLPDGSGVDLAAALDGEDRPWIVFATAYDEYALRAFELDALDYLLKPFDAVAVERVLERVRSRRDGVSGPLGREVAHLRERRAGGAAWPRRIVVQHGRELRMVRTEGIDWFASADNYVEVHVESACYLLRETLAAIEARLDPAMFSRIHRRTIVNLDRLSSMRTQESGQLEVVLNGGTVLPVGRAYREALTRRWQGGG